MTRESNETEAPADEAAERRRWEESHFDAELLQLMEGVYALDFESGGEAEGLLVTLYTTGGVLTGRLVPYRVWAEALADQFEESGLSEAIRARYQLDDEDAQAELREQLASTHPTDYRNINLVDAHWVAPIPAASSAKIPIRLRLEHVVGWNYGEMSITTS